MTEQTTDFQNDRTQHPFHGLSCAELHAWWKHAHTMAFMGRPATWIIDEPLVYARVTS